VRRLDLTASDPRFPERRFRLAAGRFFDAGDVEQRGAVAVLGWEAARDLFDAPAAGIGKRVRIDGVVFEVIGVFDAKSGRQYNNTNRPENRLVLVPQTTAEARLGYRKDGERIFIVYPRSGADSRDALRAVIASLARPATSTRRRRRGAHLRPHAALGFVDMIHLIFGSYRRGRHDPARPRSASPTSSPCWRARWARRRARSARAHADRPGRARVAARLDRASLVSVGLGLGVCVLAGLVRPTCPRPSSPGRDRDPWRSSAWRWSRRSCRRCAMNRRRVALARNLTRGSDLGIRIIPEDASPKGGDEQSAVKASLS
jgi:hypothetical protein